MSHVASRAPGVASALVSALVVLSSSPAVLAAELGRQEGALLTSLVAAAASKDDAFDVLTRDDVKKALAVEAERQSMGCEEESCLAELAGAMGARVVVYGSVGRLGDELLLTLNLFDSQSGSSGGRRVARAKTVNALSDAIEPVTADLLSSFLRTSVASSAAGRDPGAPRVKLLVLDLDVQSAELATTAPESAEPATSASPGGPLPWLTIAGAATAGLGVVGLAAGGFFDWWALRQDAEARNHAVVQKDVARLYAESDQAATYALIGYAAGGVLVAAGAGLIIVDVVSE